MSASLSTLQSAPSIDAILNKQGINGFEVPGGTDKQTIHSYGPVYEELLQELIGRDGPCVILEVGVQLGGSMLLWHDLCPTAHVIGIDTQQLAHPSIFSRMKLERYSFILDNAYSLTAIDQVKQAAPGGIDFAIDDGPHSLESQQAFLHMYLPLLRQGGIAVIEDVQAESWFDPLIGCIGDGYSFETVDRREIKGRYDDLMVIVRKN